MQRPSGLTIICIFLGTIYFWAFLFKLAYLAGAYLLISSGANINIRTSDILISILVSLLMLISIAGLWKLKKWALFLIIALSVANLIRHFLTQPLLFVVVLPFYLSIIVYLLAISKRLNGFNKTYYPYHRNDAISDGYKPRAGVKKRFNRIVLHVKSNN